MKNDYLELSEVFYSKVQPTELPKEIVHKNEKLIEELKLNLKEVNYNDENIIALAYSGHQFGYYTRLGDGRATIIDQINGYDLQLKGSGRTPYSRGGDGKASLGPMVREHLISEAMYALKIPTTRSAFVAKTGNDVLRDKLEEGALSLRVAKTHIRFGTFGYAREMGIEQARELLSYISDKLYDGVSPFNMLKEISKKGAKLIAQWMGVGFIHGVMNTDNMSLAVETIDYGPCAFMDIYDPNTVFSSIDTLGRYKYSNQPRIYQWNLARFAESILDILLEEVTQEEVEQVLTNFEKEYSDEFKKIFLNKLGIEKSSAEDENLIYELLNTMAEEKLDFTNTFYNLTIGNTPKGLENFVEKWSLKSPSKELMKKYNPVVIPRNKVVEEIIKSAEKGNYKLLDEAYKIFSDPYNYDIKIDLKYTEPMKEQEIEQYKTYCGT